ncbi:MAG: hypothetical protein EZS28_035256, partial [Streblomastix strix]
LEPIHVNIQQLNSIAEEDKKNNLGELLFGQIQKIDEPNAGKITAMLLELDIQDLVKQLEDPHELFSKVQQAQRVLVEAAANETAEGEQHE